MAYTPPTGNSVDFAFTGAAYTPPAGGAIEFAWSGFFAATVSGAVQFTTAVSAEHGVAGSFAETGITLQAEAAGIVAPLARSRVFLPLSASATGEFPFIGPAAFSGLLSGVATGFVPMTATVAGAITFRATAVGGGADITGTASRSLTMSGSAVGEYWTPYAADVAARFGFAAEASGLFSALAAAHGILRLSGSALGQRGVVGAGAGGNFLRGHVAVAHGRVGAASGALKVFAAASSVRGNTCDVSAALRPGATAVGWHYAATTALGSVSINFTGRATGQGAAQSHIPPSLAVLTIPESITVRGPRVNP